MNGKRHTSGFALRINPKFPGVLEHASDAYNYYT